MARNYFTQTSGTNTVNITIGTLISATTIRPMIYEFTLGSEATPADQAARWVARRFTAAGTAGSAVTPTATDPADPAALASAGTGTFTVEPTYTANLYLFSEPLNQRATFRWVAVPGKELKAPGTAANGIGFRSEVVTSAYASTLGIYHEE